jgi:hypothetical protein
MELNVGRPTKNLVAQIKWNSEGGAGTTAGGPSASGSTGAGWTPSGAPSNWQAEPETDEHDF